MYLNDRDFLREMGPPKQTYPPCDSMTVLRLDLISIHNACAPDGSYHTSCVPHSSFYPIHYSHTELPVDLGFSRSLLFSVCDIIAVHILFKHANSVITHHHKMYNLAKQKWASKGTVHPKTDLYDFLNWNAKDVSLNVNTKLLRTIKKYSNQRHVSTIKMSNMIHLLYSKSSALIW